ncbi:MAG: hypothetical protein KGH94_00580 [Candidatus Micrarchaeota archaeon]|nr:hypothetical protein [Candidatus Micrarchaeota archaeon]
MSGSAQRELAAFYLCGRTARAVVQSGVRFGIRQKHQKTGMIIDGNEWPLMSYAEVQLFSMVLTYFSQNEFLLKPSSYDGFCQSAIRFGRKYLAVYLKSNASYGAQLLRQMRVHSLVREHQIPFPVVATLLGLNPWMVHTKPSKLSIREAFEQLNRIHPGLKARD